MNYDPNNIFAKILRGEIPAHKVYEDDKTLAFMDVMPQVDGHTLVVPKAASRNLLDADPAILGYLMMVVQKVARAAKQAFNADGLLVKQFNEPAAGQTVFHLHVHILPRHAGIELRPHTGKMAEPTLLAKHAEMIRAKLG
ncbi:MAG: HIT family protein [Aestuariivirga sp.]